MTPSGKLQAPRELKLASALSTAVTLGETREEEGQEEEQGGSKVDRLQSEAAA